MLLNPNAPILATKTLAKIEDYLERDQGAKFRSILGTLIPNNEDAFRATDESFRSHLGASLIGRDCPREVWYRFRWVKKAKFSGRMLRLFNRGHLEESRFVALLLMIDCEVWQYDNNGKQFRVSSANGHFGGSLDSVLRGCPDLDPAVPILGEYKTHNQKSFDALMKEGVRQSKFEHFIQSQIYMKGQSLSWALYTAINKNNDALYMELIPFDREQADMYWDRAHILIQSTTPPQKINESPGWFKCKMCDLNSICHFNGEVERNCRTCTYANVGGAGSWVCSHKVKNLSTDEQIIGCNDYLKLTTL